MDDPVRIALAAAFPDRTVDRLVGDLGPSWNGGNDTVGVDFVEEGRAYLKVAVEGDGSRVARERAVLEHMADGGSVPVPAVLAADADAAVPYLATAPAPGRELPSAFDAAESPGREALLWRVGATLAALHEAAFDTHAEIVGGATGASRDATHGTIGDAGLELAVAEWTDVLRATIERTREIGTTDRLERHFDAVIDCVEANRALLNGAPAALLHGDIAKPNAFVLDRDGTQAGTHVEAHGKVDPNVPGIALIDWELAHVGDPARDLVRARDQLCNGFDAEGPARFGDAVYAGYRERAGGLPDGFESRRPIYRVVRVLGRSGFIDQWATYLDESVETLVDRIDAELDARLNAVESTGR